jgi:transcriptional regulator with XRE-family HTH domain
MSRPAQQTKSYQFRHNLRALIKARGWTYREAAGHLGIGYLLLRKYLNRGLANVTPQNRHWLEAIGKEFKIDKIELLWARRLHIQRLSLQSDDDTDTAVWKLRELRHSHPDKSQVRRILKLIDAVWGKFFVGEKSAVRLPVVRPDRHQAHPKRAE